MARSARSCGSPAATRCRVRDVLRDDSGRRALWALLGASHGLRRLLPAASRRARAPDRRAGERCPTPSELRAAMLESVGARDGFAADGGETAWVALRVALPADARAHRRVRPAAVPSPVDAIPRVSSAAGGCRGRGPRGLARVARTRISGGATGVGLFPREQVAATRLAIIGMGKTGARELNYVSDVDVIFVAGWRTATDGGRREPRASTSRRASRCRRCAGSPASRSSPRCGRSTRTCARRASRARSCARSTRTCRTTTGGRRAGSSRHC